MFIARVVAFSFVRVVCVFTFLCGWLLLTFDSLCVLLEVVGFSRCVCVLCVCVFALRLVLCVVSCLLLPCCDCWCPYVRVCVWLCSCSFSDGLSLCLLPRLRGCFVFLLSGLSFVVFVAMFVLTF